MALQRYYTAASPHRHRRESMSQDESGQLDRERRANDLKLKSRFERIFAKYSKDFTDIGDEIDLKTGEVVVNNGHLALMQDERDVGHTASSEFVRAFAEELEEEEEVGENEEDDDDEDSEEMGVNAGAEGIPDQSEHQEHEGSSIPARAPAGLDDERMDMDDLADDVEDEDEEEEDELSLNHNASVSQGQSLSSRSTPASNGSSTKWYSGDGETPAALTEKTAEEEHNSQSPQDSGDDEEEAQSGASPEVHNRMIIPSTEMPSISIEDSLNALVPHQDASGNINPAAIEQLGHSIAQQIADFLVKVTGARLDAQPNIGKNPWAFPPLPRDSFGPSRHMAIDSRDVTPMPQRYTSVANSPGAPSLWDPVGTRQNNRPAKRRRTNTQLVDGDVEYANDSGRERQGSLAHDEDSDGQDSGRYRARRYRPDEDDLIKRLYELDGMSWEQMTTYLPGRTPISIQSRYRRRLSKLPRPVMVKREIIEIFDGEDEQGSGQVEYVVHPPAVPPAVPLTSPRRQHQTPLLRRALENRVGESLAAPIDLRADDDDSDAPQSPVQQATTAYYPYGPPAYYPFKAQPRYEQPPVYRAADGLWYPAPLPPAIHKTKRYHGRPETQPRYTRFDTTHGVGVFGMMRTNDPQPIESFNQQAAIGPMTAKTGAFGMLKFDKPSKRGAKQRKSKLQKIAEEARVHSNSAGSWRVPAERDTPDTEIGTPAPHAFLNAQFSDDNAPQPQVTAPLHKLPVSHPGTRASGEGVAFTAPVAPMLAPPAPRSTPPPQTFHDTGRATPSPLQQRTHEHAPPESPARPMYPETESVHNNGPYFITSIPQNSPTDERARMRLRPQAKQHYQSHALHTIRGNSALPTPPYSASSSRHFANSGTAAGAELVEYAAPPAPMVPVSGKHATPSTKSSTKQMRRPLHQHHLVRDFEHDELSMSPPPSVAKTPLSFASSRSESKRKIDMSTPLSAPRMAQRMGGSAKGSALRGTRPVAGVDVVDETSEDELA